MRVALFLARADLRRRLGSGLALAALIGLAGAVVMTAWAGARRTESAYPRLLERTGESDVTIDAAGDLNAFDPAILRGAPGLKRSGVAHGFGAFDLTADGLPDLESPGYFFAAAADKWLFEFSGPLLVEGRMPRASADDEVIVNRVTRDAGHPVGSTMKLCIFNFDGINQVFASLGDQAPSQAALREVTPRLCGVRDLRVVGVGKFASELVLTETDEAQHYVVAGPGFAAAPPKPRSYAVAYATLDGPSSLSDFGDHVRGRADPAAAVRIERTALRTLVIDRTAQPYVRALLLFAVAAALTSAGVLGPALLRWSQFPDTARDALLGAGCRARELRAASALGGIAVGACAAILAVALSVAASPLFPIGPVRDAEPFPGVRIDAAVVVVGIAGLLALGALLGAARPLRVVSRASARSSATAESLAKAGAAPALVVGVRAALSRDRSLSAGPVATGAGVVVAVAAIAAALVFGAGLTRLLDQSARYGWTWDATFEGFESGVSDEVVATLEDDGLVAAATAGHRTGLTLNGDSAPGFAFSDIKGSVLPTILDGRAPAQPREIALGGQTLARLGLTIGDSVRVGGPRRQTIDASIVGRALLAVPNLNTNVTVGEGAWIDFGTFEALGGGDRGFVLIEVAGSGGADALRARLTQLGLIPEGSDQVLAPRHTADLRGYARVRTLPLLLAGVLGLLGGGVMAHTLVTSARSRRGELAVLKCLGFRRAQVAATVRWHAVTLAAVCAVVGVPAGVIIGRRVWTAFAQGLGVVDDPLTPTAAVAIVGIGVVVLAVVMAAVPGRAAAKVHPAIALRSE